MDNETLDKYKKAGKIASEALNYGKTLIKKDASILDVTIKITEKIKSLGGELAFPVNISLNEQAAHNTAKVKDEFKFNNELIKLDVGVHVDGFIGDTACTIDLSGKHSAMIKASEDALNAAIKAIKPGITLGEVGMIISETIIKSGFKPIKNLSGHGLDEYQAHSEPSVPNFDTKDDTKIEAGTVIAIEPFATDGAGIVQEKGLPEIYSIVAFKNTRVGFVREIISYLADTYAALPFSRLMLSKEFSEAQINFALRQMQQLDMIRPYAPLADVNNGLVTQAEHTIYVGEKETIILTK